MVAYMACKDAPHIDSSGAVLLSHIYIETIFLPRQARDKHRESTQNEDVFSFLGEDRAPEDSGALGGAEAAHPHVGKEVS